jgi:hypothetical protein
MAILKELCMTRWLRCSLTTPQDLPRLDDGSEVLKTIQHGRLMIQRYENSAVLADLGKGINALKNANGYQPDSHPMKVETLSKLGERTSRRP